MCELFLGGEIRTDFEQVSLVYFSFSIKPFSYMLVVLWGIRNPAIATGVSNEDCRSYSYINVMRVGIDRSSMSVQWCSNSLLSGAEK